MSNWKVKGLPPSIVPVRVKFTPKFSVKIGIAETWFTF